MKPTSHSKPVKFKFLLEPERRRHHWGAVRWQSNWMWAIVVKEMPCELATFKRLAVFGEN